MAKSLPVKQFNPHMLVWAREGVGFDLAFAAEKAGMNVQKLAAFETGQEVPTKAQLVELGRIYRRPWLLFLMPAAPKYVRHKPRWRLLPEVVASLSVKSLRIIQRAEDAQEIFADIAPGADSPVLAQVIPSGMGSEDAGALLRGLMGVAVDTQAKWEAGKAFDEWRSLIERQGVLVLQGPLELSEIRAFSIVENEPFVICVSSKDSPNGKIFSLIHELAHIALRDSSLCKQSDFSDPHAKRLEVTCNEIAAAFLVPAKELRNHALVSDQFQERWEEETLAVLANQYFKVSREVVLRRLVTLGLATQAFYEEMRDQWAKIPPKPRFGRADAETRQAKSSLNSNGFALTGAVLARVSEGVLTLTKASGYLRLKPKYFDRLESIFRWYA